jgi:phospholipase C
LCSLIDKNKEIRKMNRRFLLNSTKALFGTAALTSFPMSIQKALAIDAKLKQGPLKT